MDIKTVIDLEKQRKRLKKSRKLWKILSYLVAFAVFGPMLALALIIIFRDFPKLDLGVESLFLLVASILAIIGTRDGFYEWIFERKTEQFLMRYKELYLKPYIESLGFSYKMGALFQEKEVRQSEIFDGFDRFRADDLVYASADGVDFMFCDIRLEKETGSGTSSFFKKSYTTFFEGPFFVANFNKKIGSDVFVFSGAAAPTGIDLPPSALPRKLWSSRKIPIDNADFNANFSVYASDTVAAMYVLTPALMEKILSLKQLVKSDISLSFKQNKIYIAISRGADSFEPSLDQPILNARIAKDIKADLDAMLQIVKILKLNEKIWTS
ncbi:DUF3137 domain-containing protein [uncultured Campylobacter sp.]|uniref:DUF3137 domain-containing protein n=1 Tax=uncultured Campylobacter sp. TaxID=218934 RepID=UPI002636680C|nr:DUF3137 domain-containing protein [uncultured Campylobacter sp.]